MNRKRLLSTFAASAVCALGAAPAASAATTDIQQASSANWSGYVIGDTSADSSTGSGKRFSSVSGSWVQPSAKCTGTSGHAAFWVGLGGSGQSNALEQAGTEADCDAGGAASYFAWYEMVPSPPVKLGLAIHAGDQMSSRVAVSGSTVTVTVSDHTTGQSATKTLTVDNPDTSTAEWIAEAPSACDQTGSCSPLALTDFGTVTFTGASATATDGHTGTISDSDWAAAELALSPGASDSGMGGPQFASAESSAGAQPSSLSADGSSFSVAWSSASAAQSSGSSDGSGYGGAGSGYGTGVPAGSGYGSGGYGGYASGGYAYGGYGYGGYGVYGYGGTDGYGDGYGDGYSGAYGYTGAGGY